MRDEKDRILSGYFNDYELVKIDLEKYRVNVLKKKKVRGRNWVKLSFKVCSTYSVYSIKVFLKGYGQEYDDWFLENNSDITQASQ